LEDKSTWPIVYAEALDKDTIGSDDSLGYSYIWISDAAYKVNDISKLTPIWHQLYLPISNRPQGQLLLSFYIIDEFNTNLINDLQYLDIRYLLYIF